LCQLFLQPQKQFDWFITEHYVFIGLAGCGSIIAFLKRSNVTPLSRIITMKGRTNLLATIVFASISASAQAGFIDWTYQATLADISSGSTDPLGIDGDSLNIMLTYDDTNTWQSVSGSLYFPTFAASATISGHTVTLNSSFPSAVHTGTQQLVVEALGSTSFMDLVIDGTLTIMSASTSGSTALVPIAGDNLVIGHLTTSIEVFASFFVPSNTSSYTLVEESISISDSSMPVPAPATLALFGLGLAGLGWSRRRQHS
jgi:PEP-CTERM motif